MSKPEKFDPTKSDTVTVDRAHWEAALSALSFARPDLETLAVFVGGPMALAQVGIDKATGQWVADMIRRGTRKQTLVFDVFMPDRYTINQIGVGVRAPSTVVKLVRYQFGGIENVEALTAWLNATARCGGDTWSGDLIIDGDDVLDAYLIVARWQAA